MTTCEETRGRLWPYLDDELDPADAAVVASHVRRCPQCAREIEAARALLAAVAEAGREEAPPALRARVAAILDSEIGDEQEPRPARRWRRVALLPVAAVLAALLLFRPWAEEAPSLAAGFVADHAEHAADGPSERPFVSGDPPPPGPPSLRAGRMIGLSRCVVDGRAYAHYAFEVNGATVSAFVPLEDPLPGESKPFVAPANAAVLRTVSGGRAAILVSTEVPLEVLAALSRGA